MYTLKTEISFDSAHFLSGYEGKCKNIHGHRWLVKAEIKGEGLDKEIRTKDMLCDFSALKADLSRETALFDHAFIIEKNSLKPPTLAALYDEGFKITEVDFRPTAERFSKYFYDRLKALGYSVKEVTVYETPKNCAAYSED